VPHQANQDPGPERWTAAPVPVDKKWLERFTRGIRLRGSEGSSIDPLRFSDALDRETIRQPPQRAAA
jgi:hypothetical protein